MVTVELATCGDTGVIDVRFPYSKTLIERMRKVGGRKWIAESKHWHVPLDMDTCRALRRAFGEELTIGPQLRAWAMSRARAEATLGSTALAVTTTQPLRLKETLPSLHDAVWLGPLGKHMTPEQRVEALKGPGSYQAAGVHFIASSPAPVVADEQGTGKTLMWIASVWEAGLQEGNHLVVCPRTAVDGTWEGELKRWQAEAGDDVEVFACVDDRAEREATLERFRKSTAKVKWVVVNPAMIMFRKDPTRTSKICISVSGKAALDSCVCTKRKGPHEHYEFPYSIIADTTWRTLCIDEAHKGSVRNHRSLTSKALNSLKCKAFPEGKRAVMTGTPMKKKGGHDIWGLLHWLRPDVFTSSWRFWESYFVIEDNGFGKKVGDLLPGAEEDMFKTLAPYMLRRLKKDVAPWLPPKLYVPVDCFMGPKQHAQYVAMEKDNAAEMEGGEVTASGVLSHLVRLKQFANALCKNVNGRMVPVESCKVDALLEKMDEAGMFDEGATRKQLVFSQSREMVDYVAGVLRSKGLSVEVISGVENKKSAQRKDLIDRFQNGDLRVLVIVTTAGGVSLTLDAADEVHLLDEMWSPDEDQQAEDRAHRVSRIHQVTIFVYRTVDTIDQYVEETKESKRVTHEFLMDVRRQITAKWYVDAA